MSAPGRIRILLADHETLLRESLRRVLDREPDMEVVAEASQGLEAVQLAEACQPDVVFVDLTLGQEGSDIDGLRATQLIVQRLPRSKVVILAPDQKDQYAIEALKAGARGYLAKTMGVGEVVRGIRSVYEGHTLVSADVAIQVLEEFRRVPLPKSGRGAVDLTDREKDILRLLAEGVGNHEIANRLCLSEKTIENRLSVIFQKLHINNRVQAAIFALRAGLVPLKRPDAEERQAELSAAGRPVRPDDDGIAHASSGLRGRTANWSVDGGFPPAAGA